MNIGLYLKSKGLRQPTNKTQNSDLGQSGSSGSSSAVVSSGLTLKNP